MQNPHTPENWSAAASEYDDEITKFTTLYADDVLGRLEPSRECEVLEVAAGPGNVTVRLASKCRRVLATDYAPGMIERLQMRMQREGVQNVECVVMNGQALDVADASFDRAMSSFGVMLFDDRSAGFSEMRRALRPGGRAVVSGWSGPEKFEAFGLFGAAVQKALPDLPKPDKPPAIFSLADQAQFKAEMERAGFSDVRVETAEHVFEQPSKEAFWNMMRNAAPPARVLFSQIGEQNVQAVRDALFEILDARFGDGPVRLSAEATIGIGHA